MEMEVQSTSVKLFGNITMNWNEYTEKIKM